MKYYHTNEDYKQVIIKWLTNFDGTLFTRFTDKAVSKIKDKTYTALTDVLQANTNLTKQDLLEQLNRKLKINIIALNSILTNTCLKEVGVIATPVHYKNLDDFKTEHTFVIESCNLSFDDWLNVEFKKDHKHECQPYHEIWFDVKDFRLSQYTSRGMFHIDVPYESYFKSIIHSHSVLKFVKQIQSSSTEPYETEYKRFKLQDISKHSYHANAKNFNAKQVTVTINFDIDLYFSHIKYLYKVFQTYT
jgi:hypothetical protein